MSDPSHSGLYETASREGATVEIAEMLSPKEVAQQLGVSVSLVYQWTTGEGRLAHYRTGGEGKRGRIIIDPADLDAFMRSLKVEGRSPAPSSSGQVSSSSPVGPFSELDPERLARAWRKN